METTLEHVAVEIEVRGFEGFTGAAKGAKALSRALGSLDKRLGKIDETMSEGLKSLAAYASALKGHESIENRAANAAREHTKALQAQEKQARKTAKAMGSLGTKNRKGRGGKGGGAGGDALPPGELPELPLPLNYGKKKALDIGRIATAFRDMGGAGEGAGSAIDALTTLSMGPLGIAIAGTVVGLGALAAAFVVVERGTELMRESSDNAEEGYDNLTSSLDSLTVAVTEAALGTDADGLGEFYKSLSIEVDEATGSVNAFNAAFVDNPFQEYVAAYDEFLSRIPGFPASLEAITEARLRDEKAQRMEITAGREAVDSLDARLLKIDEQIQAQNAVIRQYGDMDGAVAHSIDFNLDYIDGLEAQRAKLGAVRSAVSANIPVSHNLASSVRLLADAYDAASDSAGSFLSKIGGKIARAGSRLLQTGKDFVNERTKEPSGGGGGSSGDLLKDLKAQVTASDAGLAILRANEAAIVAGGDTLDARLKDLQQGYFDTTREIEFYTEALREAEAAGQGKLAAAIQGQLGALGQEQSGLKGGVDLLQQNADTQRVEQQQAAEAEAGFDAISDDHLFDPQRFKDLGADIAGLRSQWDAITPSITAAGEAQAGLKADAFLLNGALDITQSGLEDVTVATLGMIGAFAVGEGTLSDFGDATLDAFGTMATQLAQFFMAAGAAMVWVPGLEARGLGAIAAGAALALVGGGLTALGSANKKTGSKGSSDKDDTSSEIDRLARLLSPRRDRDQGTVLNLNIDGKRFIEAVVEPLDNAVRQRRFQHIQPA